MLLSQLPGCLGLRLSTTVVIAGSITLVQGLAWMILGIVAMMLHDCSIALPITPELSLTSRLTLIIYFLDPTCRSSDLSDLTPAGVIDNLHVVDSTSISSATRTKTWASVYVAISFIWLAVSLFLIAAMVGRVPERIGLRACYPWIVVTAGTLVIDVVACVAYGMDANRFTSPAAVADVTGLDIPISWFGTGATDFHSSLVVGPLILLFTLLRGVVVWLLDLVLLIHVARAVTALHKASAQGINDIRDMDRGSSFKRNTKPPLEALEATRPDRPDSPVSQVPVWAPKMEDIINRKSQLRIAIPTALAEPEALKPEFINNEQDHQSRTNLVSEWNSFKDPEEMSQNSDEFSRQLSREFPEENRRRTTAIPPAIGKLGRTQSDRYVGGGEWSVGQRPPGSLHGLLTRPIQPGLGVGTPPSTPGPGHSGGPGSPAAIDELRREMPWSYLQNQSPVIEEMPSDRPPMPHHGKFVHNVVLPHPSQPMDENVFPGRQLNRTLSGDQWANKNVLY